MKYFELYNDDELLTILDEAWRHTDAYCEKCGGCEHCVFNTVNDNCLGSLLGELWRREMNRQNKN